MIKLTDIDDWRITDQEDYLMNAVFVKAKFSEKAKREHEHCCFCWEKFSKIDLNEGFCTSDCKYWVCENCFNDFREMFKFELK